MSTSVVTVSDSSDDEIVFFAAEPAKLKAEEKKNYGDEVIFCGIKKASSTQVANLNPKKKSRDLVPLAKDVSVVSNTVKRKADTTQNNQDPDVVFLGIRKLENELATSCSNPRVPASRARSDSFNININSQKSLNNTNVTINIDAESNKKKVKLTFLGPSSNNNNNNRSRNNASGPSNVKTPLFNPLSTSTPRARTAPLPSVARSVQPPVNSINQGPSRPVSRQNTARPPITHQKMDVKSSSSYTTIHPNINLLSPSKDAMKPNTNISNMKRILDKKLNHSSMKNLLLSNKLNLNNQNNQRNVDGKSVSVKNSERNVIRAIENTIQKPIDNLSSDGDKVKSQSAKKLAAKPNLLTPNKVPIERQKISVSENVSNSKENKSKSKENKSKSKENKSKSKEIELKSKEISQESSKAENVEKSTTQSDDKLKRKRNDDSLKSSSCGSKINDMEPVASTSGVNKVNEMGPGASTSGFNKVNERGPGPSTSGFDQMEPVASTSGINKKRKVSPVSDTDSSDSSESAKNDDESSSDSSDYDHITKPSMSKSALDALFNKFLDNCTKANKGVPVMKMKSKLKKLYLNSQNITVNEEFIIMLKEVSLRMDSKPVRDPLDMMKKIFANLRKDSPTNQKNIQKLEKVLKEINKKIKQFEEAEVTSDDDENDNVYVKLHKYRKRAVEIYNKLCELNSVPADAERPTLRNVSFHGKVPTDFTKSTSVQNLVTRVSRALEKYYNKSHKFPDFHDVRILMGKLSVEAGFKLKPETLQQLARSLFVEFGDMLQKRRLYDEYKVCNEYLGTDDEDPYYYDPILAAKLEENKKMRSKEKDVLQRYTMKQATLNESGFSDSASHSSSGDESNEDKCKRKNKANKQNHSDESNHEDSDNPDLISSKKKSNKKQKRVSSSESLTGSSDSNDEEDTKNEKTKKKKKFKKTKYSDRSDNEESIKTKENRDLEDSKNNRKRSESTKSDSEEPTMEKHRNIDEKCPNSPDNTKEISNVSDNESDSLLRYECAPTIVMDEEAERIRSGVDAGVDELQTNNEVPEHPVDINDAKEDDQVEDDIVLVIDEETNQQNIPDDDGSLVVIIDDDNCVPDPKTSTVQSEGNSSNKLEQDVDILGSMSSNNTSGLLITDVMTCDESFTGDIIVLSDDEEPRPNVLSQEDVLQLIPIIFGKEE